MKKDFDWKNKEEKKKKNIRKSAGKLKEKIENSTFFIERRTTATDGGK